MLEQDALTARILQESKLQLMNAQEGLAAALCEEQVTWAHPPCSACACLRVRRENACPHDSDKAIPLVSSFILQYALCTQSVLNCGVLRTYFRHMRTKPRIPHLRVNTDYMIKVTLTIHYTQANKGGIIHRDRPRWRAIAVLFTMSCA